MEYKESLRLIRIANIFAEMCQDIDLELVLYAEMFS